MTMARKVKPRDQNQYAAGCPDCGAWVEAGQGFLYRHSGANLGRMNRGRGRFAYVVRCQKCALKHDGPDGRSALTAAGVESSGITYTGYGANSHAPCGN
jgi:hypothetical protein